MAWSLERRRWLQSAACGFGALALQSLLAGSAPAARLLQPRPAAKRIIFLFYAGRRESSRFV
jgi:hypothetical protein